VSASPQSPPPGPDGGGPWSPQPGWSPPAAASTQPAGVAPKSFLAKLRAVLAKYGRMLWWLHSFYALGLGITVVLFAAKGFAHARFLTISLALAWVVLILFFRFFGSGAGQQVEGKGAKVRFFVMTYVLKNMYQGMLFFLLPFYWRAVTFDSPNQWFFVALVACAALSTLDVVFDRMLMKWKVAASVFYFFTLFACLNLVIPALMPNSRAAVTLVVAAAVAALAFWSMHVPLRMLGRPAGVTLLVTWTLGSLAGAYFGRQGVPPVAMHIAGAAVGPKLLEDGRLALEVSSLHGSLVHELYAVTDIVVPGGKGDRLIHLWVHDGEVVQRSDDVDPHPQGLWDTVRLQSKLSAQNVPAAKAGNWSVDVLTDDDQLVGRVVFRVID
jgi:Family of unknown function (DUF5924)/Protein of unknown function (DUF2914)